MGTSVPTPPATDVVRAFTERVRQTVTEPTSVPAALQADPSAPCESYAWCVEKGAHVDHFGRRVALPSSDRGTVLEAHFYTDQAAGVPVIDYDRGIDDWRELTSGDELRVEVAQVRAHLVRLEALADEYDAVREATAVRNAEASLAEHGATPEQAAALAEIKRIVAAKEKPAPTRDKTPRQWVKRTESGVTVGGHLPYWDEDDPSEDGIPDDMLRISLEDLQHTQTFAGQSITIDTAGFVTDEGRYHGPATMLSGSISCRPYSEKPADRVPVASVELFEGSDDYIDGMGPQDVVDLAAKLRAQADILDQVAIDLAAARADWDANGGAH